MSSLLDQPLDRQLKDNLNQTKPNTSLHQTLYSTLFNMTSQDISCETQAQTNDPMPDRFVRENQNKNQFERFHVSQ